MAVVVEKFPLNWALAAELVRWSGCADRPNLREWQGEPPDLRQPEKNSSASASYRFVPLSIPQYSLVSPSINQFNDVKTGPAFHVAWVAP